ncbi:T9SS type A sorting domain-containing protein [Kaistella faecalis]|uniref:T9SS type A sorting domain-containing protein n=1 Tax=Kaistella faecalis TaxID=2852098 RepID=UPI001C4736AB|nr:T9SS type A sorting domain-containing protein [Chryseobacterium faecale]UFK97111.1 T9SS type A sorting domain-containing protein [Chryseobacterium faecale]
MKKHLLPLRNIFPLLLLLLMSAGLTGQTTLVNFPFTNSLSPDTVNMTSTPTLSYSNPPVQYYNEMLEYKAVGHFVEISADLSGRSGVSVSFYGIADLSRFSLAAQVRVETNTGAGSQFVESDTFTITETGRTFSVLLPAAAMKSDLKVRLTVDNGLWGNDKVRIDNLRLVSGSPSIRISSDTNVYIPHLSPASLALNTDFGTRQTADAALTRTFRVRNYLGEPNSILNISNILVSGANPGDFTVTPNSLSNIAVTTSTNGNTTTYKTFNISFLPLADGLRTAEITVYSNAALSPYTFTVVGTGASCTLVAGTFAQNTIAPGQQSLLGDYNASVDLIGGAANPANSNTLNTRLYPNGDLYSSASTSWYVRNATKTVEFGGASGLDISNQKNVSITFKVAAFTTTDGNWGVLNSDNGLNNESSVTLSVQNPDNSWSTEMKLNGSANSITYLRYNFSDSGIFSSTFTGANPTVSQSNTPSTKYSNITLNIPASANISNLKFRITANTNGNNRLWLIDDVKILTSNSVYKTFTTANVWSPSAPTQYEKAVIEGSYLHSGNVSICECEVMEGGLLTIPENTSVTVRGKVINHGNGDNFIVQTGGNLIQIEDEAVNTGSITAEREVKDMDNVLTGANAQMDYVYWSAPVAGQKLRGTAAEGGFSPGTVSNRFFQYNEVNDYFVSTPDVAFKPGKGYAIQAETSAGYTPNPVGYTKTYKFKGVPNNGVIPVDVQRSPNSGTVEHGYNLIGNPYPSNMSFPQFQALNSSVIHNTAWFWTNNNFEYYQAGSSYSQNNYAVWNGTGGVQATAAADSNPSNPNNNTTVPTGIVAVGQAFIVQVKTPGMNQQLKFQNRNGTTPIRVNTAGTFFNKGSEEKDRFWVKLISPDDLVNSQLIGYIDGATHGYEQDYDAEIMSMTSDVFYSLLENRKLQIQGKGAFETTDKVQLGANIFKNGTYTIALENPEGRFGTGQKIYLKDHLLNRWIDLTSQSYTFEATKGITEGRFEIVYEAPTVLATDSVIKDELQVYRDSGAFVVKANSKKITMLEVYDASGRLVYTARPNDTKVVIDGDRLNSGVYILKINQDGVVTGKKILK